MIIETAATISPEALDQLLHRIESAGARAHVCRNVDRTMIACVGDTSRLDGRTLGLDADGAFTLKTANAFISVVPGNIDSRRHR